MLRSNSWASVGGKRPFDPNIIPLEKGKHQIKLEYETPYLKIGIITSIFGFIMFICVIVVNKVKKSSN